MPTEQQVRDFFEELEDEYENIGIYNQGKVIFSNPDSGWDWEQEEAKKYLEVGKEYDVWSIDEQEWHTSIQLDGIVDDKGERVCFNSVHFSTPKDERYHLIIAMKKEYLELKGNKDAKVK